MKTSRPTVWLAAVMAACAALVPTADATAQGATTIANPRQATVQPNDTAAPVQFSPGVGDILKLTQAKVDDEVIVAFVRNSGRHYSLTADEIVYLRSQGVSDRAITAMLNQQQPAATAQPQSAPTVAVGPTPLVAEAIVETPPTVTTVIQPASTVYIVSEPVPYYYPYYPYSWAWYTYPAFSFGFYYAWGCDWDDDCDDWDNYCNKGNPPPPPPGGNPPPNSGGNPPPGNEGNPPTSADARTARLNSNANSPEAVSRADASQTSPRSYRSTEGGNPRNSAQSAAAPSYTWTPGTEQASISRNASARSSLTTASSPQESTARTRANTTSTWSRNGQNGSPRSVEQSSTPGPSAGRTFQDRSVSANASSAGRYPGAARMASIGSSRQQLVGYNSSIAQSSAVRGTPSTPTYRSSAPSSPSYRSSASSSPSYRGNVSPSPSTRMNSAPSVSRSPGASGVPRGDRSYGGKSRR